MHLLGHVLGENFLGLHVRRMKVKHLHVDDIVLVGFVANCMTRQSSLDVDWLLPFAFSSGICFGRRCVGHGHSRRRTDVSAVLFQGLKKNLVTMDNMFGMGELVD
jgi:hypothetical protein